MAGLPFDVAAEAGFLRRGDGAVVEEGRMSQRRNLKRSLRKREGRCIGGGGEIIRLGLGLG